MTKLSFSTFKIIENASPTSKPETNQLFKQLRAGQVEVAVCERKKKIQAAAKSSAFSRAELTLP